MNLTKSSNPAFGKNTFEKYAFNAYVRDESQTMTVNGTIHKTILSLLLLVASATLTWKSTLNGYNPGSLSPLVIFGAIGGFITALIVAFKPKSAPYATPVYAILEGLFLGGISAMYSNYMDGIVFQAVSLTLMVTFAMLFAYRSGIIKVSQKFRSGVVAATGGIFLFFMLSWVLRLFGVNVPFFQATGLGIGISIAIIVVAALNLVLDFDFIDRGAKAGAPKFMEWYGAFGLMVTLVWLYLEILRLLYLISSRD